ncbi:hypothetical protein CKA32_005986 [Geitlerinema sp. FC II]|nr:hypothetical protein CKA32_005986 [Geitlerinema sp. FC II]
MRVTEPELKSIKATANRPSKIEAIAQTQLLSAWQFHRLCQYTPQPSYFGEFPPSIFASVIGKIDTQTLRQFCDDLAEYVSRHKFPNARFDLVSDRGCVRLTLDYAGEGAIGRVVRLQIDGTASVAFKAFFDPDFVWQHGPWGEIPVGIYLKASGVTRDVAEFFAAGTIWLMWEWIEEDTHPKTRRGLEYATFARREGLTALNPLNGSNYNRYGIRVDLGGVQKNYLGRRLRDGLYTIGFYTRKIRREGWRSMAVYFNAKSIRYALKRGLRLLGLT